MNKVELIENKVICENPHSPFNYFAWPTMGRLPGGELAMVCSGFRTAHVDPFGKLVICYSRNEGKTWTRPAVLIDTPLDDRDGGICTFSGGRVMVTTFNNTIEFQQMTIDDYAIPQGRKDVAMRQGYLDMLRTEDGLEEKYMGSLYAISEDGGYTFGELKISPVTNPHGPCPLPSGGLIYVGNALSMEGCSEKEICCYKLNDKDEFEKIGHIESKTSASWHEPYAFAVSDEHIIMHIRAHNEEEGWAAILQTESFDGGKTFSEPVRINEHGVPSHIMRHSSGALVCVYSYRQGAMGERVIFSKDNGKTWSDEYILTDDSEIWDLGYPSTVELSDGKLLTAYYQYGEEVKTCRIKQCVWEIPEEILK